MRKHIIPLVVALGVTMLSFTVNVNHIRDDFHDAVKSENKLQALLVAKTYPSNAVTKAYKGLASCTSAEFATWPSTKWKFFTDGKALIESAVTAAPDNPEVRYVRLMVQLNAPALVGYSNDINSDIKIFVKQIKTYAISNTWKRAFISNLKSSDGITSKQIEQLTKVETNLDR